MSLEPPTMLVVGIVIVSPFENPYPGLLTIIDVTFLAPFISISNVAELPVELLDSIET